MTDPLDPRRPGRVLRQLRRLDSIERDIVRLRLAEECDRRTIRQWLNLSRRDWDHRLSAIAAKAPEIALLLARPLPPQPKIRLLHLSQLPPGCTGPYNIDEL